MYSQKRNMENITVRYMLTYLTVTVVRLMTSLELPEKTVLPSLEEALAPYTADKLTTILIVLAVSAIALVLLGMIGVVNKRRGK